MFHALNVGFTFEWDLVRLGRLQNTVGELYADFQGVLGSDWVSFQLGRFQIPVGEAYLRYSQGYAFKPFVSNPVGAPWWWDEGVRGYGAAPENLWGYVWSVSDGDTPFNTDADGDKQVTLKLFTNPTPWLHLSVSGLRTGELAGIQIGGRKQWRIERSKLEEWIQARYQVTKQNLAALPESLDEDDQE